VKFSIYQIDAFCDRVFCGNPACVVPMEDWLPDEVMLKIAKENAVPETAFFVWHDDEVHLRWFTPEIEMDLCGHATLAAAYVLKAHLNYPYDTIVFDTMSGLLPVTIQDDLMILDFPSRKPLVADLPPLIKKAISIQPKYILKARDYVLVYESVEDVQNIVIDRQIFDQVNLGHGGVIVTSAGNGCDFVSRFFTPQASILEDPVTGSAHCSLIPYWSQQLNKKKLVARQLSDRKGTLYCEDKGERVKISGKAKTYMVGAIWVE